MSVATNIAAFDCAAGVEVRVSSRSLFADDLWHLDVATPGAALSEYTLDWSFTIYDQIQELRAELSYDILTREERADALKTLEKLIVAQAKIDRDFDAQLTENAASG